MLIMSQDKDNTVNFNNIVSIGMEDLSDSNPWQRITAETIGTAVVLGDYKTEERAKEVLQEIVTRYKNWENLKAGQPSGLCMPVYEMPKE